MATTSFDSSLSGGDFIVDDLIVDDLIVDDLNSVDHSWWTKKVLVCRAAHINIVKQHLTKYFQQTNFYKTKPILGRVTATTLLPYFSGHRYPDLVTNFAMFRQAGRGIPSLFSHAAEESSVPPLVLHCRFTKNNTMYTLSRRVRQTFKNSSTSLQNDNLAVDQAKLIDQIRPRQEVILHMSAGQAGFSGKRQRAPEAAFAATTRLFEKMKEKDVLKEPIEIVFKDFGPTRKVFLDTLFGREGAKVRPFVKRLTDLTPIKFGGDRAPNRQRK